ncbi:MAG: hypothetical protein HC867_03250 [Bacteroidia bacterium]|nr:hypothetical protein [Bacteroidia bacterium]
MKRFILLLITTTGFISIGSAQSAKSVYFELGGPGLASFNFDSRFTPKEDGIGGRIGFGGFSVDGTGAVFVPIGLNYLLGKDGKNYFELGAGATPVFISDGTGDGNFTETFGHLYFRLQDAAAERRFYFQSFHQSRVRQLWIYPLLRRCFFWL